jgi:hypothetical protein
MLVAATIFSFIMTAVTGLFTSALDMQRRGIGIQKVEENTQFVLESIAREVRVSKIMSDDAQCPLGGPIQPRTLTIDHPDRGTIDYEWAVDPATKFGRVFRTVGGVRAPMTAEDVEIVSLAFCVSASGLNDGPARVTIPMTVRSTGGRERTRVALSVQTTVISRDFASDVTP